MMIKRTAQFSLGQIVRHRAHPLRGVVVDVDAVCEGAAPGDAGQDQPFYEVFAYGEDGGFIAYVPEDALVLDESVEPLSVMEEARWFTVDSAGRHAPRLHAIH